MQALPDNRVHGKPCRACGGTERNMKSGKCIACRKRAVDRHMTPERRQEYKIRYKGKYPQSSRTRKALGIGHGLLRSLENRQENKCAICGGEPKFPRSRLCVDHNHITGVFRGLLCGHCNTALGLMSDNPEILEAAARYIRQC